MMIFLLSMLLTWNLRQGARGKEQGASRSPAKIPSNIQHLQPESKEQGETNKTLECERSGITSDSLTQHMKSLIGFLLFRRADMLFLFEDDK